MSKERKLAVWYNCLEQGSVLFDTGNPEIIKLCDNPECVHCSNIKSTAKLEAKAMADAFFSGNTPEEIKEFKDRLYELDCKILFGDNYKPRMVDPVNLSTLHTSFTHTQHMTIDEIIESGKFDFLTIGEIKKMKGYEGL